MLTSSLLLFLLFALYHHPVLADDSNPSKRDGAFLAFSRELDGDLVHLTNTTVRYHIHNVGTRDATDISLKDFSFPASRFTVHEGTFRPKFDLLTPGAGLQADVIITPKKAGMLIVSPASLSYFDGQSRRVSQLASDESVVVEDVLSYRRRTDRHRKEWIAYLIAFALLSLAPYLYSDTVMKSIDTGAVGKKRN